MAGVELVAYLVMLLLVEVAGRRPVLSLCQLVAGLSCVAAGCVPPHQPDSGLAWLRLALALVGKMGASAGFAVVFVYTVTDYQLQFPTYCTAGRAVPHPGPQLRYRVLLHPGQDRSAAGAQHRLAALRSARPALHHHGRGCSAGTSQSSLTALNNCLQVGSLSFLLPETQHAPLPETVEQAERQGSLACCC